MSETKNVTQTALLVESIPETPKIPIRTFAYLNKETGLLEVIDELTGEVVARQRSYDDLLLPKSERLKKILLPDGSSVYLEQGLSPEDIGVKASKYPFSQVLADIICQRVASGEALTRVCGTNGIPGYTIVSKWRRKYPDFQKALEQAYGDRAEVFHDKIQAEVETLTDESVDVSKEKIKGYQWLAGVGSPDRYGSRTKVVGDPNAPLSFVIDTGVRRPGDEGYNVDETEKLKLSQNETSGGDKKP